MINKIIRNKIYNNLTKLTGSDNAKIIEESIYQFSIEYTNSNNITILFESIYNSKADEMMSIIKKNLKFIITSIKNNTIDPKMIAFMKPSELNIKKYANIIKKRELDMMLMDTGYTDAFECIKCKKHKCNVIEKQVRSGDEPATQFVTCLECGHVFQIND